MTALSGLPQEMPVRPRLPYRLRESERNRISAHAAALRREDPALDAPGHPVGATSSGFRAGPSLVVHDISVVRLESRVGISRMEYRALLLAGEGDIVAVSAHRSLAFEEHVSALLGLEDVRVYRVEKASAGHLLAAAREDAELLGLVSERARSAGRFTVRPYCASEEAWALAAEIAARANVHVHVAGPPPALAERVNDKLWFTSQASAILGAGSVPPSAPASDMDELVRRIRELEVDAERVALRLRAGAGGEGNLVLPTGALATDSASALKVLLGKLFITLEWDEVFPLQVAIWEHPVLQSPSVQLWIPAAQDGPPVVEGVFEQRVEPERGGFAGVATSTLPDRWQQEVARQAGALATLFQELGYFGRCSFDMILVGEDLATAELHWVECNGRWGGTSIPMTAVERITGDWTLHPFVALDHELGGGRRIPARDALDTLGELALRPGDEEGVLLLTPTGLETGRALDLLAIARSRTAAAELADRARDRLLRGRHRPG